MTRPSRPIRNVLLTVATAARGSVDRFKNLELDGISDEDLLRELSQMAETLDGIAQIVEDVAARPALLPVWGAQ